MSRDDDPVPEKLAAQYDHDPVYCTKCSAVVALTVDRDAHQPMRFECTCTSRGPTTRYPAYWENLLR